MDFPDSQDLICPITFQEYTSKNPPVTLPCGHTLSLEASQKSLNPRNTCPICRAPLPERYIPQKSYLLAKILESIKGSVPLKCSQHEEENAIAICTNEKTYICVKCLKNDKCPEESIIPKEKFKAYLLEERAKMNEKESEILEGLLSDVKINQDVFSLVNPLLVDVAKWELSKQYYAKNLQEKQGLTQRLVNCGHSQVDEHGQIKVLKDIERYKENLEGLKAQEEVNQGGFGVNKIVKKKLISLLCEEPTKISIDNSLKEMKENVDKDFCEELEICFKGGFNNRGEFINQLKEMKQIKSLSLHNLAAFEEFGERDLGQLLPICRRLTCLNMDFAGLQRSKDETPCLHDFFRLLKEIDFLEKLQLSFKESDFIAERDLIKLCEYIRTSNNLSSIALNLEKCKEATNEAVQRLLEASHHLNEFSLNLFDCPHLNQETLKRLTKCFWHGDPNLNRIKTFSLKLGHSQHISNSWLQAFSFYLGQMRISRLTLHFQACSEIEYQGVNHLISAISQVGGLKELDLSFVDCEKFSGVRVLKNLGQCVSKLKNLKVFLLCIKECPKFHFDGLERFRREVKNVPVVDLDCPVVKKKKRIVVSVVGL